MSIYDLIQSLLETDLPPDTPVKLRIEYSDSRKATELATSVYFEDSEAIIIEAKVEVQAKCRCGHSKSVHTSGVTNACDDYGCVTQGGCGMFEEAK